MIGLVNTLLSARARFLLCILLFCSSFAAGWGANGKRLQTKFNEHEQAQALAHERQKNEFMQQLNAEHERRLSEVARLDQTYTTELNNAKHQLNDLKRGVYNGTVRLRECNKISDTTHKPEDRTSGMGNNTGAESSANQSALEQDVLQLAEYASHAISQRDYLIEFIEIQEHQEQKQEKK